jgi:Tfp pilus assembly protein PilF
MLNPNDSDSSYNLGLCHNLKRQTDKAKQDFQGACELGDKDLNNGRFDASRRS